MRLTLNTTEVMELVTEIINALADGRIEAHELEAILDEADDLIPVQDALGRLNAFIVDVAYQDADEKRARAFKLRVRAEELREKGRLKVAARKDARAARLELEAADMDDAERAASLPGV